MDIIRPRALMRNLSFHEGLNISIETASARMVERHAGDLVHRVCGEQHIANIPHQVNTFLVNAAVLLMCLNEPAPVREHGTRSWLHAYFGNRVMDVKKSGWSASENLDQNEP